MNNHGPGTTKQETHVVVETTIHDAEKLPDTSNLPATQIDGGALDEER